MKKPQVTKDHFREYMCSFNSLFAIWGVHPSGLDLIPFKSKKYRSSYLIVVSPRGSNETNETVGMKGFSYQGNDDFAG